MEPCDELDEQCTRTCKILRVYSTNRALSSLNGVATRSRVFWRKRADEDDLHQRDRTSASMEHHSLERVSGENEEGRGQGSEGIGRTDLDAPLYITRFGNRSN